MKSITNWKGKGNHSGLEQILGDMNMDNSRVH